MEHFLRTKNVRLKVEPLLEEFETRKNNCSYMKKCGTGTEESNCH